MRAAWLSALAGLCACGPVEGGPADAGQTFLAFPTDFKGYAQWESFSLTSTPVAGSPHTTGERVLYLSRRPPRGATEFPVGTIIVKSMPPEAKVFAMVKRGGGYNPDQNTATGFVAGALGWEWFELDPQPSGDVAFVWRGVGPPSGEGYGGDPNGCNSCHVASRANDFVQSGVLNLQGF
jgi:hypothetical protein